MGTSKGQTGYWGAKITLTLVLYEYDWLYTQAAYVAVGLFSLFTAMINKKVGIKHTKSLIGFIQKSPKIKMIYLICHLFFWNTLSYSEYFIFTTLIKNNLFF